MIKLKLKLALINKGGESHWNPGGTDREEYTSRVNRQFS